MEKNKITYKQKRRDKMKNRNEYGFYSSGYIYDRLNHSAVLNLCKQFPELKDKQLFTTESKVFFIKQLSSLDRVRVFTGEVKQVGNNAYYVENTMRKHSTLIAYGFFTITTKGE